MGVCECAFLYVEGALPGCGSGFLGTQRICLFYGFQPKEKNMICSAGMGEQMHLAREERGTAVSSADRY